MLEEVAPFAVIATVRYLDLLTIHVILNLVVPYSLPMRVIPVDGLQKTHATRTSVVKWREISQRRGSNAD